MKKWQWSLFFSVLIIVLHSCDPPAILILENHSKVQLKLNVNHKVPLYKNSLSTMDTLLSKKEFRLKKLNSNIPINRIDSSNYTFILKPNQTVSLQPSSIRYVIDNMWYSKKQRKIVVIEDLKIKDSIKIHYKFPSTFIKID